MPALGGRRIRWSHNHQVVSIATPCGRTTQFCLNWILSTAGPQLRAPLVNQNMCGRPLPSAKSGVPADETSYGMTIRRTRSTDTVNGSPFGPCHASSQCSRMQDV